MATKGQLSWKELVYIATRTGINVIEAPSSHRGKKGRMGSVAGVVLHHTGTPNTYKPELDFPDYQVVKEGRPGLENSLSAYGIGRHKNIYVFSEFLSWHAGVWNWNGITDGNGRFLGIEGAGVGDWTPFQRDAYPRLVASALSYIGEGLNSMPRHADGAVPHGRKIDAANLVTPEFIRAVQGYLDDIKTVNIFYRPPAPPVVFTPPVITPPPTPPVIAPAVTANPTISKETDMAVLITAPSDDKVTRAPAILSGFGGFMGLATEAEVQSARAVLPEINVEPYTWDALAEEKATLLAGAKASVELANLLRPKA